MSSHKTELDRLAKALLEYETLTAEECEKVVGGGTLPSLKDKISSLRKERDTSSTSGNKKSLTNDKSNNTKNKTTKGTTGGDNNTDKQENKPVDQQPKSGIWASVFGATVPLPNTKNADHTTENSKGTTDNNNSKTDSSKGKWN